MAWFINNQIKPTRGRGLQIGQLIDGQKDENN